MTPYYLRSLLLPPISMHCILSSTFRAAGLFVALSLGGCLAMPAPPPGLPSLSVTKVNSARVTLWNVWFENRDGRLFLCGHVFRHYPATNEDTSGSHLTITLFSATSERLRELPAEFEPRQIPRGSRGAGYSVFAVPLDVLPESTNHIQIRAYDDPAPLASFSPH